MKAEPLGKAESLLLDVIRISAAALVAVGHITQPYFSTGWPDLTFLAEGFVAVFFVLSGFVIRYVTCRRRGTFESYSKDRASRIYSVVIPALLVTVIADSIARHVNPAFYLSNWGDSPSDPRYLRKPSSSPRSYGTATYRRSPTIPSGR